MKRLRLIILFKAYYFLLFTFSKTSYVFIKLFNQEKHCYPFFKTEIYKSLKSNDYENGTFEVEAGNWNIFCVD